MLARRRQGQVEPFPFPGMAWPPSRKLLVASPVVLAALALASTSWLPAPATIPEADAGATAPETDGHPQEGAADPPRPCRLVTVDPRGPALVWVNPGCVL